MTGSFSEESLAKFAELASQTQAANFSEGGDTYDFTRCVRPDGTAYGTRGRCRKGSEEAKAPTEPKAKKAASGGSKSSGTRTRPLDLDGKDMTALKDKVTGEAKPKRKLASSAETKPAWQEAVKAFKAAKAEFKRVMAETKGDNSKEAQKRRLDAGRNLDKAERIAEKASIKHFAATKRESRAAMTPAQRKEEREWNKFQKVYG